LNLLYIVQITLNRVECAHKVLKDDIQSSQGDLLTTWRSIEQAVANQIRNIKASAARDRIRTPLDIDRRQYHACFSQITVTALRLAHNNHQQAIQKAEASKRPLEPCTGVYTITTGLPCAHKIENTRQLELQPQDFHAHWFWDRYSGLVSSILEPLQVISYTSSSNQSSRRPASSTRRLPSGFEATEDKKRRCSQCRLTGHTRASPRCPVNIRRLKEEFAPRSASQLHPNPALWVPRSTIQHIFDSTTKDSAFKSAVKSLLQSSGQYILKSTIQSLLNSAPESTTQPVPESTTQPVPESTTQPVPESTPESTIIVADTRPIWPGRPELIYRQYLAEKEAWLADNPGVGTPASYRRSRGLEIYSASWIRQRRQGLPIWRLDLDTKTLLKEDIAEWSNEEVSAWLDWGKVQDQEAERQAEAELIEAGGFGRTKMRGIRGL
jgi:hypothetical protein